jgi:hypothetical protein
VNQQQRHKELVMSALALATIDRNCLATVHGGYDLQRTLNAGASGAKRGSFVGGSMAADAENALMGGHVVAGPGGAFYAGRNGLGASAAGSSLSDLTRNANLNRALTAGIQLGETVGAGVGWVGGAARDAWSQLTGH